MNNTNENQAEEIIVNSFQERAKAFLATETALKNWVLILLFSCIAILVIFPINLFPSGRCKSETVRIETNWFTGIQKRVCDVL
jgi:hypothetical protein